jgi:hypothetical protein
MQELIYGRNNLELSVMCYDGEARILRSQPLFDFLHGKRDLIILKEYYGQELFRILVEDAGFVRYENNKFALSVILEIDMKRTVMRMMGKIAEAVIVRRCWDNEGINLKWLRIASRKQIRLDTAQKFEALGTGLESTKRKYPQNYSPSDPQRDIIWVMGNGLRAQMKGSTGVIGMDAGLQVKVSKDGIAYILKDIIENRYEVPMVYFDLNGDFYKVADRLFTNRQQRGLPTLTIESDFIHAKAIDPEGYEEVSYYVDLIAALVDGRITPEDLINEAEKYPTMRNAVLASAFESMPSDTLIVH